jgi:hypothetical protein
LSLTEISKKLNEEMSDENSGNLAQKQELKNEMDEQTKLSGEIPSSDESMYTAPNMSSSSSFMGLTATFSMNDLASQKQQPSLSSTSSQYVTAASSMTHLEVKDNFDVPKTSKNEILKSKEHEMKDNDEEDSGSSSESINERIKKMEELTNKQLNEYFEDDITNLINNVNNNSFKFEPPLYSSSDENLNLLQENDEGIEENILNNKKTNTSRLDEEIDKNLETISENENEEDELNNSLTENKEKEKLNLNEVKNQTTQDQTVAKFINLEKSETDSGNEMITSTNTDSSSMISSITSNSEIKGRKMTESLEIKRIREEKGTKNENDFKNVVESFKKEENYKIDLNLKSIRKSGEIFEAIVDSFMDTNPLIANDKTMSMIKRREKEPESSKIIKTDIEIESEKLSEKVIDKFNQIVDSFVGTEPETKTIDDQLSESDVDKFNEIVDSFIGAEPLAEEDDTLKKSELAKTSTALPAEPLKEESMSETSFDDKLDISHEQASLDDSTTSSTKEVIETKTIDSLVEIVKELSPKSDEIESEKLSEKVIDKFNQIVDSFVGTEPETKTIDDQLSESDVDKFNEIVDSFIGAEPLAEEDDTLKKSELAKTSTALPAEPLKEESMSETSFDDKLDISHEQASLDDSTTSSTKEVIETKTIDSLVEIVKELSPKSDEIESEKLSEKVIDKFNQIIDSFVGTEPETKTIDDQLSESDVDKFNEIVDSFIGAEPLAEEDDTLKKSELAKTSTALPAEPLKEESMSETSFDDKLDISHEQASLDDSTTSSTKEVIETKTIDSLVEIVKELSPKSDEIESEKLSEKVIDKFNQIVDSFVGTEPETKTIDDQLSESDVDKFNEIVDSFIGAEPLAEEDDTLKKSELAKTSTALPAEPLKEESMSETSFDDKLDISHEQASLDDSTTSSTKEVIETKTIDSLVEIVKELSPKSDEIESEKLSEKVIDKFNQIVDSFVGTEPETKTIDDQLSESDVDKFNEIVDSFIGAEPLAEEDDTLKKSELAKTSTALPAEPLKEESMSETSFDDKLDISHEQASLDDSTTSSTKEVIETKTIDSLVEIVKELSPKSDEIESEKLSEKVIDKFNQIIDSFVGTEPETKTIDDQLSESDVDKFNEIVDSFIGAEPLAEEDDTLKKSELAKTSTALPAEPLKEESMSETSFDDKLDISHEQASLDDSTTSSTKEVIETKTIDSLVEIVKELSPKSDEIESEKLSEKVIDKFNQIIDSFVGTEPETKTIDDQLSESDVDKFNEIVDSFIGAEPLAEEDDTLKKSELAKTSTALPAEPLKEESMSETSFDDKLDISHEQASLDDSTTSSTKEVIETKTIDSLVEIVKELSPKSDEIESEKLSEKVIDKFNQIVDSFVGTEPETKTIDDQLSESDVDKFNEIVDSFIGAEPLAEEDDTLKKSELAKTSTALPAEPLKEESMSETSFDDKLDISHEQASLDDSTTSSTKEVIETKTIDSLVEIVKELSPKSDEIESEKLSEKVIDKFNQIVDSFVGTEPETKTIDDQLSESDVDKFNEIVDSFIGAEPLAEEDDTLKKSELAKTSTALPAEPLKRRINVRDFIR